MVIIRTKSNTLSVEEEIKKSINVGSKETENRGNGNSKCRHLDLRNFFVRGENLDKEIKPLASFLNHGVI